MVAEIVERHGQEVSMERCTTGVSPPIKHLPNDHCRVLLAVTIHHIVMVLVSETWTGTLKLLATNVVDVVIPLVLLE